MILNTKRSKYCFSFFYLGVKELKRIFTYILIFVLSFDIISYSYFSSVYASDIFGQEWFEDGWLENDLSQLREMFNHPDELVAWLLTSCGAIVSGDALKALTSTKDYVSMVNSWVKEGKIRPSGGHHVTVDVSVTQEILDDMKQYVSDNGCYTLMPTFKATDFSPSKFGYTSAYKSFFNACSTADKPFVAYSGANFSFNDLPDWPYVFIRSSQDSYQGVKYGLYSLYTESTLSCLKLYMYHLYKSDSVIYNSFSEILEVKDKCSTHGPFKGVYLSDFNPSWGSGPFIVSSTGVSVPVFNSLDDYVNYQLENGLYYVGSSYDGTGKEITITVDDFQKIQDGYYDGMYEQLQKLIKENNVSPLDYEKLAQLADQVLNSLDGIEQNTGESNSILQKILNVLNDMNGFLHTNITGSSDIDLSSLYSRLDSVVNELRSMSSALGNMSFSSGSSGGSVDVDVGGIEDRLDGMALQLVKEADTLEALNNAVDGTNSTLAELNSNISGLSSSLDDMYKSLDGLKAGADNTDVINKLSDVQAQIELTNSRLGDVYDVIHKYLPLMSDILQELKDIHKTQVGFGVAGAAVDILQGLFDDLGGVLSGIIELPEVNIRLALDDFNKAYEDTGAVEMLKKKFPFSIPWDIAFLVGFLADEPQAPKFELPLVFEKFGINEKLVIDFEDFEVVSKVSRTLLTIIYLVALMKFTTNIITKE